MKTKDHSMAPKGEHGKQSPKDKLVKIRSQKPKKGC